MKGNVFLNNYSCLFGAGVVFIIGDTRVIREPVEIVILKGAIIRIAVLVLFIIAKYGIVHIAVYIGIRAVCPIFLDLFQHAFRLIFKATRRRFFEFIIIKLVVRI
jgi:hypothetical protein